MEKDRINETGSGSSKIEEILKERDRLEKILKEKYEKEVAVLFSDICGYTPYIDKMGDIAGRALLLKHNRILFPIIEEHNGEIVELVGDAVLAAFSSPLAAVRTAIAIQEALNTYNLETDPVDRIHVKIGIHAGEALVDDDVVFNRFTGDVVNVANRIMTRGEKDQILVSKGVYEEICGIEDVRCRFFGSVRLKGKPEPLDLYQVMWSDEETIPEEEPTRRLQGVQAPSKEQEPDGVFEAVTDGGTRDEISDFAEREEKKKRRRWLAVAAGIVILALVLFWLYPGLLINSVGRYEREALAYFNSGAYDEAIQVCETLQKKRPKRSLGYLILGNIHFLEGDLKKADRQFEKALEAEDGNDSERAEALIGLGRIASIEKNDERALDLYRQAAELDPQRGRPYLSQGILLDRQGKYDEALKLFIKAQTLSPDDRTIHTIVRETGEKAEVARDKEKQERIDALVRDLLVNIDRAVPPAPSDGWTSPPLTVLVMEFTSTGYGLQEGEERLVSSGVMDRLIQSSGTQVVERVLLDKLLEELRLGTSRLVDQGTALSLGKILAARVILSGQIHHVGPQIQVAVRVIETETGRIAAAVNEVFMNLVSPFDVAEKLSDVLIEKLSALYPLRGKISDVGEKGITLNIGQKQGVQPGFLFKVVDQDWILEVGSVDKDKSTAKVKRGYGTLRTGLRVEHFEEGQQ